ncbi:MAG TPA: pyrroline-5-carboxylate reductase [Usitatibacter sp.]|nr:pyrroline-5-carboxylate reductase [Usitatibacter sp.]
MKLAFVGGGNMARAIIGGLVARGTRASDIGVIEPESLTRLALVSDFGVATHEKPGEALAAARTVVFAVKPQHMREAARAAAPHIGGALVITVAAGVRIEDLSRWLGGHTRVVRAMPNMPALVHAGVAGLYAAPPVGPADREAAESLLSSVGAALWFEAEGDLDAVTAVSGSGPAYVFYAIEALEEAARSLGLAEGAARSLALWTFVGAAKLAVERGEDPARLRAQVTSRGGTTERALQVLEEAQVKRHFIEAVRAACERSRELGADLGKD